MIHYFTERATEEYIDYLKYQLLDADPQLSSMLAQPEPSEEDLAVMHLIGELLDRLESEAHLDKAIALRAVVDHIMKESPGDISLTRIAAMLTALLEQFPLGVKAD